MNLEQYFTSKTALAAAIARYEEERLLRREAHAPALAAAHLDKAKHNLRFVSKNMTAEEFNDWTIVGLYYAVYHAGLALLSKKGHVSNDHTATLLLLIKEYGITRAEAALIDQLRVTKEDAEFYAALKEKRRQASYATNTLFRTEKVRELRTEAIRFINKAEELLKA